MQGAETRQLIKSLRQALDSLPDLVKQGVTQALGAAGSQRVQQQFVRCTSSAAMQDHRTAEAMQHASAGEDAAAAPKVDFPIPSVETSMKSMEVSEANGRMAQQAEQQYVSCIKIMVRNGCLRSTGITSRRGSANVSWYAL